MLRLIVSFSFFVIFLWFALYEGSFLLMDNTEWNSSTKFTHFLYTNPNLPTDIVNVDFFIYAIKFRPVFPVISLVCLLYGLYILLRGLETKYQFIRKLRYLLGGLFIVAAFWMFSTLTVGTILFSTIVFIVGLGYLTGPFIKNMVYRNGTASPV
nr:DUF4306 domain-containing protein [Gracilibacillus phocaeensis]